MIWGGGGEIGVDPAPPFQEGQEIEVTYTGSGTLYWRPNGSSQNDWEEVPLDPKTGQGKVTVPVGARSITLSDRAWPKPAQLWALVVGSFK